MLNIAGSFATAQLRKLFQLSGAAQPSASEDVQLVQHLDAERLQPYGQWRRAAIGLNDTTILAQPYSFGIINPVASNSIVVVERVFCAVGANVALGGAINTTLDVANGALATMDETDSANVPTPILWFRNQARAAAGQIVFGSLLLANQQTELMSRDAPLYPGHELNWGFSPGAPVAVAFTIVIRWVSPSP